MSLLGSIGAGLFDFATSAWSMNEQQKNADLQAWVQRNYQSEREDTAYQRTVKDLTAAGLSPMLAYSKGSTPVSTSPVASSSSVASSNLSGSYEKSLQSDLAKEEIEVAKSQKLLNESNALKAQAESVNVAQDTENKRLYPGLSAAQIDQLTSLSSQHGASAAQLKALADEIRQNIDINKPKQRYSIEEPEKAKWQQPLQEALRTIFQGLGEFRGLRGINRTTTTSYPGGKTTSTTKGR